MSQAAARRSGRFRAAFFIADGTASCLRRLPVSAIIGHEDFSGYTPARTGHAPVLGEFRRRRLPRGQVAAVHPGHWAGAVPRLAGPGGRDELRG